MGQVNLFGQWNEATVIVVWTVAIVSLFVQLYLLMTWPRQQSNNEIPIPDLSPTQRSAMSGGTGFANAAALAAKSQRRTGGHDALPELGPRQTIRNVGSPSFADRVIRAGIYSKTGPATVCLVRIMLTIGLFAVVFLASTLTVPIVELRFLLAALAGIAGYLAPSFWLDRRLRFRQTSIRRALPDALDLITVCMRGGLSLPGAMARVSRELATAHPLLASEMSIVEREVQMGRTSGGAMRHFAQRLDLEELRSLSSVVWQTEKFGGSIVGALTTYASSMRTKRKQRAEEMAQKAAVKLLFPTLLCIFPGIFVVILGPTAIRVYQILIVGNPMGS